MPLHVAKAVGYPAVTLDSSVRNCSLCADVLMLVETL